MELWSLLFLAPTPSYRYWGLFDNGNEFREVSPQIVLFVLMSLSEIASPNAFKALLTFKTHYVTSSKILIQCSFRSIVMNPVRDLTLAHHIDACTTLLLHVTHGLHFPSTIALITQLSPITHCTDYMAESHQTLFISLGLPLSLIAEYCLSLPISLTGFPVCFPVDYLDRLHSSDRLLPAFLTLPVFWIFSLSAACPDLCIVPVYCMSQPCLRYSCCCWLNFACLTPSCLINMHLDLNVTDPSLHL